MVKLNVLDLFSGIGMFSYGLEKTGFYKTVQFVEWNEKCQEVLKKNFEGVPIHGDIATFTNNTNQVDIIVGGFPCQDISIANQTAEGISGDRSSYWKDFARLIEENKPKGVIIENVSALLSRGLNVVLADLAKIGYDAEWHCITAKNFGACHTRDRIFIIAYPSTIRMERKCELSVPSFEGQRRQSVKEDLQQIYSNPFGQSSSIPKPLLRRVDDECPDRVDRIKQLGNTVYNPIVEHLGYYLKDIIDGKA